MSSNDKDFLHILQQRGFLNQATDLDALSTLSQQQQITAYIGFDATADSLHVGSLVQIMMLRWLQKTGNKPIVLMGGGTTRIGDPSGKDESRQILTTDMIDQNLVGIQKIFAKYLEFGDTKTDAVMVNNADWLLDINYIDFLRDTGRHFTINRMLSFDSVKTRLDREQPLTFLEFNYMLLQAYDFMELSRRYNCNAQMGGSDQWGNIVNGIELTRRVEQKPLYGITTSLLTTASGAKMGKTASGAVWLNEERLPVYDFWQFWRNTEDADVVRFLKLFTELPLAEIDKLAQLQGSEINEAKKVLAHHATALCHGEEAALRAAETAQKLFEQGIAGGDIPQIQIPHASLAEGLPAFEILKQSGLCKSGGEARRMIKGGGAKLNDKAFSADDQKVSLADITAEGHLKLSVGKKKHVLIVPAD